MKETLVGRVRQGSPSTGGPHISGACGGPPAEVAHPIEVSLWYNLQIKSNAA